MTQAYSDAFLKDILTRTQHIAVVGVSMNEVRPSYYVARYLTLKGFDVIPVNPGHAGKTLFGKTVVGALDEIEGGVDMVDIFRRSEHVPPIVDAALAQFPDLGTIWMQIGVMHEAAAEAARARCRCGDEPLPQDRVSAPLWRVAHGWVQHRRDLFEIVMPGREPRH